MNPDHWTTNRPFSKLPYLVSQFFCVGHGSTYLPTYLSLCVDLSRAGPPNTRRQCTRTFWLPNLAFPVRPGPTLARSQACSTCTSLHELAWSTPSVSGGLHVATFPGSMVVNATSSGHTFASDLFRCLVSHPISSWESADKPRESRRNCREKLPIADNSSQ